MIASPSVYKYRIHEPGPLTFTYRQWLEKMQTPRVASPATAVRVDFQSCVVDVCIDDMIGCGAMEADRPVSFRMNGKKTGEVNGGEMNDCAVTGPPTTQPLMISAAHRNMTARTTLTAMRRTSPLLCGLNGPTPLILLPIIGLFHLF